MGGLCNLRYLGLKGTSTLTFVAEGLGKLTRLRTLNMFLVCDNRKNTRGCNIRELTGLNKLRGELWIKGLGGSRKVIHAEKSPQLLNEKHGLVGLYLDFKMPEDSKVASASEQSSVMEALEPPYGLKELKINDYKGQVPAWFLQPNYPMLQTLELQNCPLLAEAMGTNSLETLEVEALMPALKSLRVWQSNGLKTLTNMCALEELTVSECGSLEQVADGMPALKWLTLSDLNALKQLPACLPSLERMTIISLANWEGWPAGRSEETTASMSCLIEVYFKDCPKIQMQCLMYTQLQQLTVLNCPNALGWKLLKHLPNLVELRLDGAALESTLSSPLPSEVPTFLPSLKYLFLCDDNDDHKWGRMPEWVWGISQLEQLCLSHFTEEISLGGHWQYLQKLTHLQLCSFPNLKSLVDVNIIPQQNNAAADTTCATDAQEQISHLSKLEGLFIFNCPPTQSTARPNKPS